MNKTKPAAGIWHIASKGGNPFKKQERHMKNSIATLTVFASALALAACGSSNETSESAATEETAEVATAEPCTQDAMMAKATKLGEKMQALASDPEAMQEMASKMQEVQGKIQAGAADGSFGITEACAAYDEMLAAAE